MALENLIDQADKYLSARGIDDATRDVCGISIKGYAACLNHLGRQGAQEFLYEGGICLRISPTQTFVRVLGESTENPNWVPPRGRPKKNKKPPKCYVSGGTGNQVYDPPNQPDCELTLYLCESALKAMALCAQGYSAVGLNGCTGLITKGHINVGMPDWLDDHEELKLAVLFDSDSHGGVNAEVERAVASAIVALERRYSRAEVFEKQLPHGPDGKWGIDDAIAANGEEWLHGFMAEEPVASKASKLNKVMLELNSKYRYVEQPAGNVVDVGTNQLISMGKWMDTVAKHNIKDVKVSGGNLAQVVVDVGREWRQYAERADVGRLVYDPGKGAECEDGEWYNLYDDDGVVAKEGDTSPFWTTYRNAVPDHAAFNVYVDCMAYLLQNPGSTLDKIYMFAGVLQGSGKSLLSEVIADMFGESNCAMSLSIDDLMRQFTGGWARKRYVRIDETPQFKLAEIVQLKKVTSIKKLKCEHKGKDAFEVPNFANFTVTTNEMSCPIAAVDRRFVMLHFDPLVPWPEGDPRWDPIHAWIEDGGVGALRWELEHRDLSGFKPNFMPEQTSFKAQMTGAGRSEMQAYVQTLVDDPESVLPKGRSVYSPMELLAIASSDQEDGMNPAQSGRFSKALGNAGLVRAHGGKAVRCGSTTKTYFVLRGRSKDWTDTMVKKDVQEYPIS